VSYILNKRKNIYLQDRKKLERWNPSSEGKGFVMLYKIEKLKIVGRHAFKAHSPLLQTLYTYFTTLFRFTSHLSNINAPFILQCMKS